MTPCSQLHSSTEKSICCASCVWSPFSRSCLGGTWSISHRSNCDPRCRTRSLSDSFLDFFESAPRLQKIYLLHATPTSGAKNGRLASLACLKWMDISGDEPPSLLLDHLIIPVGAKLATFGASRGSLTENLPRSLDNLMNLSDFTDIRLRVDEEDPDTRSSGPNGQARVFIPPQDNAAYLAPESLAQFDTSKSADSNRVLLFTFQRFSLPGTSSHEAPTHPHTFSLHKPRHLHPRLGPHHESVVTCIL